MSIVARFKSKLAEIRNKPYEPKFQVGDFIYNKKYGILRKVEEIVTFDFDPSREASIYKLTNISNPLTKNSTTSKNCTNIDAYYVKVNEKTAKILYGKV